MKKIGSVIDFALQREADIRNVFRQCMAKPGLRTVNEIYREVAQSAAERFWVSEERAENVMYNMLAGRSIDGMLAGRRKMYEEIFRRVVSIREESPDRTIRDIVAEVVNQPAPSFYLTAATVEKIMHRSRHRRRG